MESNGIEITIETSSIDGTPVVYIDTDIDLLGHNPEIRVNLNDFPIHVGVPLPDQLPEEVN